MRFSVLGPVRVEIAGTESDIRVRMHRRLLAALLANAGRPVASAGLMDALWADYPPGNAVKSLQIYVHRLRRELGDAERIRRHPSGYAIVLEPGELDSREFENAVQQAIDAHQRGDLDEAAALLDRALGWWRGRPYEDVEDNATLRPEVERLSELRIRAIEEQAAVALDRGRHAELIPVLFAQITENPYRERLCGQLMLALFRSGRQAEAIEVFMRTCSVLAEELGIEPGEELRRLHEAIVRGDPGTGWQPPVPYQEPVTPPAQLPPDLATLTGRTGELDRLLTPPDAGRDTGPDTGTAAPGTVVISAIDGMAGVGKTALAVHAAHRLAAQYPDGQLFLDLHGFTREVAPLEPAVALERMLRAMGVPGDRIPGDVEDRSALWRSRLAGRRVLVVLDNAATEEQVRPLLPGSPGCLVLITSRRRLSGLDDTRPLTLDVLPLPDAVQVFRTLAGVERTAGEPEPLLAELVSLCGRLPLALRLLAVRFRDRAAWTLPQLLSRLRDEHRRLATFEIGRRSVAGAFQLSYEQLDPEPQRLFRLLGTHPASDFDGYAAAALLDTDPDRAEDLLEVLLDAHLVEARTGGRYTFHDLLRTHAAETASRSETEEDRLAASGRLLDYYLAAAVAAMQVYAPWDEDRRAKPAEHAIARSFATVDEVTAWMDAERANLVEAARLANVVGAYRFAGDLSLCVSSFFETACYPEEFTLHDLGLAAMRALGDAEGEGRALINLGDAYRSRGDSSASVRHYLLALDRLRETGIRKLEAVACNAVAAGLVRMDRHAEAREYCAQAIELSRAEADRLGELRAHRSLGHIETHSGRYVEALESFNRALDLARLEGARAQEAVLLLGLGGLGLFTEDFATAQVRFEEGLALYRELKRSPGDSVALSGIGHARRGLGDAEGALPYHRSALAIALRTGYRNGELEARIGLGQASSDLGQRVDAVRELRRAVELAQQLEQAHDEARAHEALGAVHDELGQAADARAEWQRAWEIYRELGGPAADRVAARLAALGDEPSAPC